MLLCGLVSLSCWTLFWRQLSFELCFGPRWTLFFLLDFVLDPDAFPRCRGVNEIRPLRELLLGVHPGFLVPSAFSAVAFLEKTPIDARTHWLRWGVLEHEEEKGLISRGGLYCVSYLAGRIPMRPLGQFPLALKNGAFLPPHRRILHVQDHQKPRTCKITCFGDDALLLF